MLIFLILVAVDGNKKRDFFVTGDHILKPMLLFLGFAYGTQLNDRTSMHISNADTYENWVS